MRSDFSLNRVVTQASRVFCVCAVPACMAINDIVIITVDWWLCMMVINVVSVQYRV